MITTLSLFAYPERAHARRHGPRGYVDYASYKPWLRDEFAFRCVYCLFRERWYPSGYAAFSVDHSTPQMLRPDLVCDYGNLLYACSICNSWKSDRSLPDPCVVPFSEHFRIKDDGSIEALSRQGMRMIKILRLDQLNEWRLRLLRILARIEQVEPAADTGLRTWFGYPDDLPELESLRPPDGNSRPDGIAQSHLSRLRRGELPTVY